MQFIRSFLPLFKLVLNARRQVFCTFALGLLLTTSSVTYSAVTYIDIWEFRVDGNTLLDESLIQRRLERYLGVARTLEDVEAAVETLTNEYRNAGYPAVFVDIPPQTVVNGRFQLRVNETRLRRLRVTDASYFLPSAIKQAVPSLALGRSINLPALQQEIQNLNTANPHLKVVPILKQGPTPELIDVELSVADDLPIKAGVEVNNYNSANTTDTRLSFDIGYDNLWQKNHQWSFTAQTTPEDTDEVKVISTSYVLPLNNQGDKLAMYSVVSDSETATVGDINVIGEGFIFGARGIKSIQQEPGMIRTLIYGFDYKDFDEVIQSGDGENTTPIEYATFTVQLSQYQRTKAWYDSLSLALTFGVRGIVNSDADFGEKRSRGEPSFAILKAEYERSYPFGSSWGIGDDWLFTHRLNAQLADTLLVSNEQISAGGVNSVRGYFESQVSGDYGASSGLEVKSPVWPENNDWMRESRFLGFVEGAWLGKKDSGIDEEDSVSISGIGLGWRAKLFEGLSVKLDTAFALTSEGEEINKGDNRTNASLRYDF